MSSKYNSNTQKTENVHWMKDYLLMINWRGLDCNQTK